MSAQRVEDIVHGKAAGGRDQHYMTRVGPIWVCACGERRDRYGRPLPVVVQGEMGGAPAVPDRGSDAIPELPSGSLSTGV